MPKAKLIVNGQKEIEIGDGITTIGRVPDNAVSFSGDSNVSRYHAEIETRGSEFWLIELGSSNGTSVNGISVYSEKILRDGDVILFGGTSEVVFETVKQEKPKDAAQAPAAEAASPGAVPSGAAPSVPSAPSVSAPAVPAAATAASAASQEAAVATDMAAVGSKTPTLLIIAGGICALALVCVVVAVVVSLKWNSSCQAKAKITKPENFDNISKETDIEVETENTECVKRAIFFIDDEEVDSETDDPYTAKLEPDKFARFADGTDHTLKIVLEDDKGNRIDQPDVVQLGFETAKIATPTPAPTETTTTTPTPTPKPKDTKQPPPADLEALARALLADFPGSPNYKFDPQFLQEVQKKTADYAADGYYNRAQTYSAAINGPFQELGVVVSLGYITAMSRTQFKLPATGDEKGLWRMTDQLVTAKGYNGLCAGEALSDSKQNCAARSAALYLKDLNSYFTNEDGGVVYAIATFGMSPQDAITWKSKLPTGDRADFAKMIKSPQREELVKFFAAGIVAKNPQRFGLKDPPISEIYKNYIIKTGQ